MKLIDRDELVRILNKRREFYCNNTPDSFSKLSYPDKCRVDMLDTCISDAFNIPSKSFDSVIEDVKAEMKSLIDWHDCPIELDDGNDSWYCHAVNRCLEIIDKHIGKAESEDKE